MLVAQASRAGIFDDNEARRKIDSTEARVTQGGLTARPAPPIVNMRTVLIASPAAPSLRIRTPDGGSRDVTLTASSYTLGRNPESDTVVNDPAVSRTHARLGKRGDGTRTARGRWRGHGALREVCNLQVDELVDGDASPRQTRLLGLPRADAQPGAHRTRVRGALWCSGS